MNRVLLAIFTIVSLLGFSTHAQAQSSRLYFAGYLGLNSYNNLNLSETTSSTKGNYTYDNTVSLAGALGLRLTPQWRIEGEISRRVSDFDTANLNTVANVKLGGQTHTWLYLLNLYYDVDWQWKNFQPFLTAGLGLASHDVDFADTSGTMPDATGSSMGFAWSLGGGLKYRIQPNLALTGNYRYIGTNDIQVDSHDFGFSTHEIRLGVEYDLPTDWFH